VLLVKDKDTWRAAYMLVRQHGGGAELFATRRMDEMIAKGDEAGEAVWKRIRNAIVLLQRTHDRVLH
jgi:hypothetical protein